jgi:molybdopterin converting factor small subunit
MEKVQVKVYPWLTDRLQPRQSGCAAWEEELADGGTLKDLLRQLQTRNPAFAEAIYDANADQIRGHVAVIVNDIIMHTAANLDTPLSDGDCVTFLPTISGG